MLPFDRLSASTRDPVLAKDAGDERRHSPRAHASRSALLRCGVLTLGGEITDFSSGGVFLSTQLLVEIGERGLLTVDDVEIGVQVVWLRGNAHREGPGMGLAFDLDAEKREAILGALSRT
jgi:PilZ domain-containing protein